MLNKTLQIDDLQDLCNEISEYLQIDTNIINGQSNLFQYGMDSMHLMSWVNRLRKRGHKIKLKELYNNPTPFGWYQLLKQKDISNKEKTSSEKSSWPIMKKGESFELTPVQHAYFVGRATHQTLGGVGCHLYQEFDGKDLSAKTLEKAIYTLIERHNMLKVRFNSDGSQQYQGYSYWNGLTVHDFKEINDCENQLLEIRKQLNHRVLSVENGETFDIQLSLLPNGKHRIHVNIDLLILDAASFSLFFEELSSLILGVELDATNKEYDFRSYIAELSQKNALEREDSKLYWQKKMATLALSPELPLAKKPEQIKKVTISRNCEKIQKDDWVKFEKSASSIGVTPTMLLATCFGAVLSRWSNQQRLLLNLTLFDRSPLHESVDKMMADFTNILLLDLCCNGKSLCEMMKENQNTFIEAYEHRHWTGVEVLRELKKSGTHSHGAPIVFTCNLGRSLYGKNISKAIGEPSWGISQTPQVWIDHLAYMQDTSTYLRWDSNNELFPPHLVDSMFESYISIVRQIISNPDILHHSLPDLMPTSQYQKRKAANQTEKSLPKGLLHQGFFSNAEEKPNLIALIDDSISITYSELNDKVKRCAKMLIESGVSKGDKVAITMSKGIGQIVSSLAILQIGAVYVPVALEQPSERLRTIYTGAEVTAVIVCKNDCKQEDDYKNLDFNFLEWQDATNFSPMENIVHIDDGQPAYIIYTSGSTGIPKGVVISHKGALNTCCDINQRYNIGEKDRVLALSEFHFDLSVYDIFGVLNAGGAIVLLKETNRRDPSAWCQLITQHNITIWNTVPALFDMLLTYSEGMNLLAPESLNYVMLSGDWIGLDLPKRYHNFQKNGKFIAMGGATEASIWSNILEVNTVPDNWRSIPYGFPLANQQYRVVDNQGRDCPDWVSGELWIGGEGVALGYFKNTERTNLQFLEKDKTQWYRTGDMGCYWTNGMLEFIGRKDKQVKVGGYRIELGEIETALNQIDGVKGAVSLATGNREKSLIAFAVTEGDIFYSEIHGDLSLPNNYSTLFETINIEDNSTQDISELTADFIYNHLQQQGIDFSTPVSEREIMDYYGAQNVWHSIFKRWLEHLEKQEYIKLEKHSKHYTCNYKSKFQKNTWLPTEKKQLFNTIEEALLEHHTPLSQIIKGQRSAQTLLDHPILSPENLLNYSDGSKECVSALAKTITQLSNSLERPVKIVEIGARSGITSEKLLQKLDVNCVEYIAIDESQEMVLRASERLKTFSNVSVRRQEQTLLKTIAHKADIVFANNSLHRSDKSSINTLYQLSKPSGLIYVLERMYASDISLISVDLFSPEENGVASTLRNAEEWQKDFIDCKLQYQLIDKVGNLHRFVFRAPNKMLVPNPKKLLNKLANHLPNYMIPQKLHLIEKFPLTINGKIDNKALINNYEQSENTTKNKPDNSIFKNDIEKSIAKIWGELLNSNSINRKSNFFQLGGDSLLATRLIGRLNQLGYKAELIELFNYPELDKFSATIVYETDNEVKELSTNQSTRYEPFPLSDIQQAYLAGRKKGFLLGGVGSQFFVEFEVGMLDIERFEKTMDYMITRHDMLRAIVQDGKQRVLHKAPKFILKYRNVDKFNSPESDKLREELSTQVIDPNCWPVFDVQAIKDNQGDYRLFVCLDNLILDGLSMKIFFAELEQKYLFPNIELPELNITFRDYLVNESDCKPSQNSITYWKQRLKNLPSAPKLPIVKNPSDVKQPKFIRFSDSLTVEEWSSLKDIAKKEGITPSALLLSVYSTVLSSWSSNDNLCINLTLFDRKPVHPQIERVLGDFTSLLLVSWETQNNWRTSVQKLQQRLQKDIVHSDVSALWVMRQIALEKGHSEALMPVVFTSALGFEDTKFLSHSSWLKPHGGISQTPQIWLDHQVYETGGELCFNWDAVEQIFDFEEISLVFKQYKNLLCQLSNDPSLWDKTIDELVPKNISQNNISHINTVADKVVKTSYVTDKLIVEDLCMYFEKIVKKSITPDKNFFEAGATSLQLIELHNELQLGKYRNVTVTDLFTYPTPYALAGYFEAENFKDCNKTNISEEGASNLKQKNLLKRRKSRATERKKIL